ncbi:MAG: chromosome segregation protein SMC [Actinomycetes bacterium]
MHLKSLTLKGFKSFASATTLRFEPGITAVVGPNGSGKSNVIDALAWVMGEQGAKSLRGGKMEDVIFAGTAGRAPLGRAEVSLTIDNTDGALPIDYTEVTISRLMFRNGGSEYSINGTAARLLDVQELLSDSGIGREMHVIVGQGQLDGVLSATPEDRRGFIEEAAGVLKHRKRKEKALRKLEAMEGNLTRLTDLTAELRRQLKPLGKQAEVARRAAAVQADLRDARLRLLADDLLSLRTTLAAEVADETALRERREQVERALADVVEREQLLEAQALEDAPRLSRAQETWYRLSSLRERLRGTASLAEERLRHTASAPGEQRSGRDPDELDRQAAAARADHAGLVEEQGQAAAALSQAVQERSAAEQAAQEEERRVAAALRAAADRREGLARLAGQVAARRSRVEAGADEVGRLAAAAAEARERADRARQEFAALETQVAGLDEGEEGLDATYEQAAEQLEEAEAALRDLREQLASAERDAATSRARREALELGLARKDGTGHLVAASAEVSGVLGTLATLVRVPVGAETAVSAALGLAADAVTVAGPRSAVAAFARLREHDAGQATVVIADDVPSGASLGDGSAGGAGGAGSDAEVVPLARPEHLEGLRWAGDGLLVAPSVRASVSALLSDVVIVEDLAQAADLVTRRPDLRAVTADGDVLGRATGRGGSGSAPSLVEVQAAVDEAAGREREATARVERLRFALPGAQDAVRLAADAADAALSQLHESDARMAAVAEQLSQLGAAARSAAAESERLERARATAEQALESERVGLAELEARLEAAESGPVEAEPSTAERDRLGAAAAAARAAELEARLAVRTLEERVRAIAGRAESLERAARQERDQRAREVARREQLARAAAVAGAVREGCAVVLARLEVSLTAAAEERAAAEAARTARDEELAAVRSQRRDLAGELERLVDSVHRDEVARAEQRLRIEALEGKSIEELGVDPDTLIAEYGPDQLIPVLDAATGEPVARAVDDDGGERATAAFVPFVREEQEKRLRAAERALALLGKVNPLALEEFAALEERHAFLTTQLEDLKATRRDLMEIVREVDERVQEVFAAAYADTAREFEGVFSRLFPGGEGRLLLTNPDDMLTTGIEVEARPPGKKVKRLSLLSGGERSLTAVALLVAIFKARPSPFYVMDEVEAALDDTNLGRLLGILEELRERSQLIIITHQKRTMEIADALYGVSMRGDGVTTVISQRMREPEPV